MEMWAGTSFSCGLVAGTVALMLKRNPKLTPDRVKAILQTVGFAGLVPRPSDVSSRLKVLDAAEAVRAVETCDRA